VIISPQRKSRGVECGDKAGHDSVGNDICNSGLWLVPKDILNTYLLPDFCRFGTIQKFARDFVMCTRNFDAFGNKLLDFPGPSM
jgi:hypothetical protein